jgi:hypothetical protein
MNTPVEFSAQTGLTLTVELYPYGSDTIANGSGDAATEATNRKTIYTIIVTEALVGWHHAIIMHNGVSLGGYDVLLADDEEIHRCEDRSHGVTELAAALDGKADTIQSDVSWLAADRVVPWSTSGSFEAEVGVSNSWTGFNRGKWVIAHDWDTGSDYGEGIVADDGLLCIASSQANGQTGIVFQGDQFAFLGGVNLTMPGINGGAPMHFAPWPNPGEAVHDDCYVYLHAADIGLSNGAPYNFNIEEAGVAENNAVEVYAEGAYEIFTDGDNADAFKADVSGLATGVAIDAVQDVLEADVVIDKTTDPDEWAIVFYKRGTATELFRKNLKDVDGDPLASTSVVVGRAVEE